DNDDAGRKHGQQVARSLQGLATSVKVVALPGLPPKGDVSDWLDDGHTVDELLAIVEAAPEWEPKDEPVEAVESSLRTEQLTDGRQIIIGTDEPRVIDEAVETLATRDNVFVRGGYLVHIIEGTEAPRGIVRPREAPRIAAMRHARIRELLAAGAEWLRPNAQDELERVHPPDWAVKAVDARGEWPGIRVLEAAVESLVLRADGSVLQQKGYDPATGIMFLPQCEFPAIAEKPTRDDAIAAGNSLLEVVEDFPFASEEHSASWVAGVLTPLARYAFRGPSPLFLHDANVRGCGKSLLTDTVSIITTGREMARMSLPRDDDELRKRITSLAMAGEPLILIDNIAGTFGSPSLDAALTATSWSDRILGQSAMAAGIPMFAVWFATGNNVVLAADTARRVVHIRLESPEETPEERTNFHHPDLLAWVRQERPRLTAAAVTILAGYCAAGRPDMKLRPWGSYEGWSDLIRQAVVWVGMVDPGASRRELASVADREAVALRQLLENWHELDPYGHGITLSQVIRELTEHPTEYDGIRTALLELAPPRDGKTLNPRSVGMKLHHLRRRVVGGRFLDNNPHQKVALWFIRGGDSGGTNGTSGSNLGLTRARLGAHTHENLEGTGDSPISPASPATCQHATVDEQDTFDGFVNLVCHDCGAPLGCREERVKA
ncbi:MAG: hypothetical protein NTW96_24725, partial [Planctomycetia bacterium]|nr:hypothetical protein [Planctomycetia bacterium]